MPANVVLSGSILVTKQVLNSSLVQGDGITVTTNQSTELITIAVDDTVGRLGSVVEATSSMISAETLTENDLGREFHYTGDTAGNYKQNHFWAPPANFP